MKIPMWTGVLTLVLITACTRSATTPPAADTLRAAIGTGVTNFYLKDSLQKNVWNFNLLFAQALFVRTDSSQVVGDLAESMILKTPLLTVIKLRPGARFHDQNPVRCEDVIWSFEDARHAGSPYKSTFDEIASWTCQNGQFELHLKRPVHGLIERLVSGIRIYPAGGYPKHSAAPIGSGPYQFVSASAQKSVWRRFDGYVGPLKPHAKTIEIFYIPDSRTRYEWLQSGKLDLLLEWPVEMDPILAKGTSAGLAVHEYPTNNFLAIGLSLHSACFAKLQNRQALANEISRHVELLDGFDDAGPFNRSPPPSKIPPTTTFDSASCARVKLMYPAQSSFAYLGVPLAQQLRKNLHIVSTAQESSVFYAKLGAGAFEAFVIALPAEDDAVALFEYLHSTQLPPQKNRFFYQSPSADRLVEQLRLEQSAEDRRQTLSTLAALIKVDIPFIPLGRTNGKLVTRPGIDMQKSIVSHPWLMMTEAVKTNDER